MSGIDFVLQILQRAFAVAAVVNRVGKTRGIDGVFKTIERQRHRARWVLGVESRDKGRQTPAANHRIGGVEAARAQHQSQAAQQRVGVVGFIRQSAAASEVCGTNEYSSRARNHVAVDQKPEVFFGARRPNRAAVVGQSRAVGVAREFLVAPQRFVGFAQAELRFAAPFALIGKLFQDALKPLLRAFAVARGDGDASQTDHRLRGKLRVLDVLGVRQNARVNRLRGLEIFEIVQRQIAHREQRVGGLRRARILCCKPIVSCHRLAKTRGVAGARQIGENVAAALQRQRRVRRIRIGLRQQVVLSQRGANQVRAFQALRARPQQIALRVGLQQQAHDQDEQQRQNNGADDRRNVALLIRRAERVGR